MLEEETKYHTLQTLKQARPLEMNKQKRFVFELILEIIILVYSQPVDTETERWSAKKAQVFPATG